MSSCLGAASGGALLAKPTHILQRSPKRSAPRQLLPLRVAALQLPADGRDKPVFESWPPQGECTLFDARDAIETCEGLQGDAAEACFLVFGLDCEQTRKWYPSVAKLEAALAIPDEDNDEDTTENEELNPWQLPSPIDEMVALWQDAAEAIMRAHNASAHN